MLPPQPTSTLFPYTTLFRSQLGGLARRQGLAGELLFQGAAGAVFQREERQAVVLAHLEDGDRKSTRLNSSHGYISYAVFCLKKKNKKQKQENIINLYTE